MKKFSVVVFSVLVAVSTIAEVVPPPTGAYGRRPIEWTEKQTISAPVTLKDTITVQSDGVIDISTGALKADTIAESTSGSGVTIDGVTVKDGSLTQTSAPISTPTSLSVTNGQEITVQSGVYILNGVGSANDNTNTVTVANGDQGTEVRFVMLSTSTNLVLFADSGNLALSGNAVLDNNDTLELYAVATNSWVETAQVNN